MIIHFVVNPEAIVKNIVSDLKTKERAAQSISQMLYFFEFFKDNCYISLAPELKNLLVVILKESVFIELYLDRSTGILSAIQIKSAKISSDFSNWFDGTAGKNHEPEKDYAHFRKEILKNAKTSGIPPKDVEAIIQKQGHSFRIWLDSLFVEHAA